MFGTELHSKKKQKTHHQLLRLRNILQTKVSHNNHYSFCFPVVRGNVNIRCFCVLIFEQQTGNISKRLKKIKKIIYCSFENFNNFIQRPIFFT